MHRRCSINIWSTISYFEFHLLKNMYSFPRNIIPWSFQEIMSESNNELTYFKVCSNLNNLSLTRIASEIIYALYLCFLHETNYISLSYLYLVWSGSIVIERSSGNSHEFKTRFDHHYSYTTEQLYLYLYRVTHYLHL